ncbi:MAG TPA: FAD-dependent oxidoreductase [Candidatus Acidoferrales bacterium]|jgi:2-polyprenyl-6-methoxyphenol hydroxylase-like FAD-dependent oxidoreductase|nr:FAD-dependent oxidoreductase [Candidatus Acidoferrales bacterium]
MEPVNATIDTGCCIVGGGPAGMMLGFLLARAGVDVVVLEKHADFLRDFRGDTIHPSTLELIHELGLLEELLRHPHQEVRELAGQVGNDVFKIADFTHLPTHCKFLALMPQWDFLNFIVEQGRRYPRFQVTMQAQVTDLIEQNGRIIGARARTFNGVLEVRARLTVGADGRHSIVRDKAGLEVTDLGAPMDVLWMRISRRPGDPGQSLGHVEPGRMFIMIDREDYWQCAFLIPKGAADEIRKRGIEQFRADIANLEPVFGDRVSELRDWNDVSLLTVRVDRLTRWWRPGLLCIGDAAHAMSPVGGVGINLAIQDAVAAANILAANLAAGSPRDQDLHAVQQRRQFPTRATQRLQVLIQNKVISRILSSSRNVAVPWPLKLMQQWPWLRRIPARVIGIGFRPEHVRTPQAPLR